MRTKHQWAALICAVALAAGATMPELQAQQPVPAQRQTGGPPAEGIGVHGYWKIDVRNPDGSLASHTEFENALTAEGQSSLVNVLLGANLFGSMNIDLNGSPAPCATIVPLLNILLPIPCFIAGTNLTAAVQGNPSGALVLTGTTTATSDGVIDVVSTKTPLTCGSGFVPCGPLFNSNGNVPSFTSFDLRDPSSPVQPIPVTTGQLIQVSVTLSFS